jgi:hypothetical protein
VGVGVRDGGWRYAAASVIGTSHQTSPERVCQDAFGFQYLDHSDTFVGVVSDGAGSASHSQIGSEHACRSVLEQIALAAPRSLFDKTLACEVVDGAREALQQLATKEQVRIREFACTLLVAIIGAEQAAFWQIGDGAICFRRAEDDRFNYVFWPEKGVYANVTFFLTDANAQEHLEWDLTNERIEELAIFSDGLERLALDFVSGEAHSAFFNGLFPHVRALPEGRSEQMSRQIAGFLSSERVNKRTDDDKTLILASRAV